MTDWKAFRREWMRQDRARKRALREPKPVVEPEEPIEPVQMVLTDWTPVDGGLVRELRGM